MAAFAGFCVYGYYKFVRLEDAPPEPAPRRDSPRSPPGLLPERPEPASTIRRRPALREYNAYLADLAEKDKES